MADTRERTIVARARLDDPAEGMCPWKPEEIELVIDPRAPVALVRLRGEPGVDIYDLARGRYVGGGEFVHTDSTGTYTA